MRWPLESVAQGEPEAFGDVIEDGGSECSLHRDAGYLAVGLTIVYAVSGLAVNHVSDWDPSFKSYERVRTVATPLPTWAEPPGKSKT